MRRDAYRTIAGLILLAGVSLAGCSPEEAFTDVPAVGVATSAGPMPGTHVFVGAKIDLDRIGASADAAVPGVLAHFQTSSQDGACGERHGKRLCVTAQLSGEVVRDGPIEVTLSGNQLELGVPLRYSFHARGTGWARSIEETKSGRMRLGVPIEATLAASHVVNLHLGDPLGWPLSEITVLDTKVDIKALAESGLRSSLEAIHGELRTILQINRIRDLLARAWTALHEPIPLLAAQKLWLRGTPRDITSAGFARVGGEIYYRAAIGIGFRLFEMEQPAPLLARPLPQPGRGTLEEASTSIRASLEVDATLLHKAVAAAIPTGAKLATRATPDAPLTHVHARRIRLHPAHDLVAVEIDVAIDAPADKVGRRGKVYILARPVYLPSNRTVVLRDLAFPDSYEEHARGRTGPRHVQRDIVGLEPFAGRINRAATLPVSAEIMAASIRMNEFASQWLHNGFRLTGMLDRAVACLVRPRERSFRLYCDFSGELMLIEAGGRQTADRTSHALRSPPLGKEPSGAKSR